MHPSPADQQPSEQVTITPDDGTISVRTGVEGRGARLGHRLAITFHTWKATVELDAGRPKAARLVIDVGSLAVTRAAGGATPFTAADRSLVRRNALRILNARRHPHAVFESEQVSATASGYEAVGTATVAGASSPATVEVEVSGTPSGLELKATFPVSHSQFGIAPYSQMLGALRVTDLARVEFSARVPLPQPNRL